MTKTLKFTLAISSILLACGQSPAEPLRVGNATSDDAVFSTATDDELYATLLVGTGADLAMAYFAAVEAASLSLSGCTKATTLEDGVSYEGTGDPGCGMSGTITVHGVSNTGWVLEDLPSSFAMTFNEAEIRIDMGGDEPHIHLLDGMVIQENSANGQPLRTEANLTQSLLGEFEIHSAISIERDADDSMTLTHSEHSEAFVEGVGWFAIEGSTSQVEQADGTLSTEGQFAFRGQEMLVYRLERDSDNCLPFTIDGQKDRICGY